VSEKYPGKSSDAKIQIVGETDADEDFLGKLYFSARSDEFSPLGWDAEQLGRFLTMQYKIQKEAYRLQFPDAENLIIWLKKEKIGRLIVNRSAADLRLIDISLLPEFRGSGFGTKIISDLQSEAGEKNLPLTLNVARNNSSAFRLYQKLGFQTTGEDEMYVSMQWRKLKN
jgi:ribosomal protein S18 acetylase RimI-like enzyme